MNIELIGKDVQPSEMLRGRIESKLEKIERRLGKSLFVRVKLDTSPNHKFTCGVHFQGVGTEFNANATSDDLIKAAVAAMKLAHPYEEPAYDVWQLADI